jgi:hypothetical protein
LPEVSQLIGAVVWPLLFEGEDMRFAGFDMGSENNVSIRNLCRFDVRVELPAICLVFYQNIAR